MKHFLVHFFIFYHNFVTLQNRHCSQRDTYFYGSACINNYVRKNIKQNSFYYNLARETLEREDAPISPISPMAPDNWTLTDHRDESGEDFNDETLHS